MLTLIKQILWPPLAPINASVSSSSQVYWRVICALCVIPLTAILHHAVFYPHTCILDPFGPEYTPAIAVKWLSRDPSLPWSIIVMTSTYHLGNHHDRFNILVSPAFISFVPLSLWVWDIPFTKRIICRHFHGGRLMVLGDISISRRYFYLFGFVVYLLFVFFLLKKQTISVEAA